MIVVTGAAGFIGSCLLSELHKKGFQDLVAVDDFSRVDKLPNLLRKKIAEKVDRAVFHRWLDDNQQLVQFIFHLGARTDTTEFDKTIFDDLNVVFSKGVWERCVKYSLPLVYASSAATYGGGEHGYSDAHEGIDKLKPLNPYGDSKQEFDLWALAQEKKPYFWAGLKFFNVYGPNEYHKGRMASVVYHAFKQIKETGGMKLFRSHNPDYMDGEQLRDFIYVKDVLNVMLFFMITRENNGIYNLGTGSARTFLDLTKAVFKAMDVEEKIGFIDTPEDIRDKYQYYTQADMSKLNSIGFDQPFCSLEEGVTDYVQEYLRTKRYF
jgi:ADP-L-glycero-D-manno-heptose 6-epimerase